MRHLLAPYRVWAVIAIIATLPACVGGAGDGVEGAVAVDPLPAPVEYRVPAEWKFADLAETVVDSAGGMVASDAELATDVGVEILDAGGNAVDAAIATAFALAVVYPTAGNVGGGGFMVVRLADGSAAALDFRETAPAAASRDMYLDSDGEVTRDAVFGHRASGVPGSVAGLWAAHQRFGSLPWGDLVAPAIGLAAEGFVADADFVEDASAEKLEMFDASRVLFRPGGKPIAEGDRWSDPDLAAVLERVSASGADGFYQGETADLLVAEMERGGGLITHADLLAYEAKWRDPVVFGYRGFEVISMPPPSGGGLTLALIANILEGYDLRELGWHSPAAIHRIAEAMRFGFAYRNHWLGDPDFVEIRRDLFLSEEVAGELRRRISPTATTPPDAIDLGTGSDGSESMHTTHFSVVDAAGNAVALTTTINHGNGSGVVVAGAGFLMNNEMDDFASKPGSPNMYGLVQGETNAIAPGKRMLSSMTPTIVAYDGAPILVTGASGGPTIITGVVQILANAIDYGFDIGTAVRLPRFHQQHLPDVMLYEDGGLSAETMAELEALGHELRPARFNIATGASLLRSGGRWTGTHDPRVEGAARGQ